jgi:hypothetical protein
LRILFEGNRRDFTSVEIAAVSAAIGFDDLLPAVALSAVALLSHPGPEEDDGSKIGQETCPAGIGNGQKYFGVSCGELRSGAVGGASAAVAMESLSVGTAGAAVAPAVWAGGIAVPLAGQSMLATYCTSPSLVVVSLPTGVATKLLLLSVSLNK